MEISVPVFSVYDYNEVVIQTDWFIVSYSNCFHRYIQCGTSVEWDIR